MASTSPPTCIHANTHASTHASIHASTYINTHTHARTHARTHAHNTQTYTQPQPPTQTRTQILNHPINCQPLPDLEKQFRLGIREGKTNSDTPIVIPTVPSVTYLQSHTACRVYYFEQCSILTPRSKYCNSLLTIP